MLNYWRNQAHSESNAHIRGPYWYVAQLIVKKKKKCLTSLRKHVSMDSLPDKNVQINIRFRKKAIWRISVSALNAIKLLLNFFFFFTIWIFPFVTIWENQSFCGFCPSENIYLKTLWRYLRHGSSWFSAWCRWKNWGRSFVCLCACACVYASQRLRRFNGPHQLWTDRTRRPRWRPRENPSPFRRQLVAAEIRQAHLQVKHT